MKILKIFNASLRSKILAGYSIVIFIMLFVTFWSVYNFYRLNESIKTTLNQNYSSIIAAENMVRALDDQFHSILLVFTGNSAQGKKLFESSKEDFYFWYTKARQSAFTKMEQNILDDMNLLYGQFLKETYSNINWNGIQSHKIDLENNMFNKAVELIRNIKLKCNSIYEINHKLMNNTLEQVNDITRSAAILIAIILVGGIIISYLFVMKFSNYVVRPLLNLTQSVQHIANGNFDEKIDVSENNDEINNLAVEFNKMSEQLRRYEKLNVDKLLYEKKKSELIIESMYEPVAMIDNSNKILLANNSFKELFDIKEEKSLQIEKLIDLKEYLDDINSEEKSGKEKFLTVKDKNGNLKYFKINRSKLERFASEMTGTVIVFNDVTKFQELDRMKSEFIGKVSHELKTPLTSLGMALEILGEGIVGNINEKQKDLYNSMKQDYNRLNKLVYEILQLTKLQSGSIKIEFNKIDLIKLTDDLIQKFRRQYDKTTNIALNFFVSEKSLFVNGNSDYLISAFENLISNSYKFTGNSGTINVSLYSKEGFAFFEVQDNGIGIEEDQIGKIFDKFYQVDSNVPGSIGIGLSIVKEIVEIHKGTVKAWSEPKSGSTFQIKLPIA
ncbi:ATP-binding protein [Melioribacteraceae bacterium 4301-Me]|uniref:HAMP domain-containing sensor histidine kinase n=1 Tax=Pyranulibacter aquaticus TaxID=3163344 RepID=UPI00359B586B